jgi:Cu-Zn family superoxide dismutase
MHALGSSLIIGLVAAMIPPVTPAVPSALHLRTEWSARLSGKDGRKVSGAATAVPAPDGAGTVISISLEGDTPGATRPWHVHSGSCAASGGVVGGGRAYMPLTIDAKGKATGKATIAVALPDTGAFYVNIHDAAAAMNVIVACGDLARK